MQRLLLNGFSNHIEGTTTVTLCGFGVSNYYNKLKLILREKEIPFAEETIYPWQRDLFWHSSPIGKIPYLKTAEGDLSESQVILEYLEEKYPDKPIYPAPVFERAKCRELIQHLELNCEWVARSLYRKSFFGGIVSDEKNAKPIKGSPLASTAWRDLPSFHATYTGLILRWPTVWRMCTL